MSKSSHTENSSANYRFTLGLSCIAILAVSFMLYFRTMGFIAEQLSYVSYDQLFNGFLTL